MLARDQDRPLESEADGMTWRPKRKDVGDGYTIVDMQFALSAVVEQAECGVAALLNLGEHDARAERVAEIERLPKRIHTGAVGGGHRLPWIRIDGVNVVGKGGGR